MNYYDILGCDPKAPFDEIKRKYQELVKKVHPDKGLEGSSEEFLKIDEAWKTLRDDALRKEYDAKTLQSDLEERDLIYAEVNISNLIFDEEDTAYYPCRCGDHFNIAKDLLEQETLVECNQCSNCLLVKT